MSAENFFCWLANCFYEFYPSVVNKIPFPIIIFMDGHTSHINVAVYEFCREKEIILFCFIPHASHLLQPLDISVYGPLKNFWNESLNQFAKKYRGLSMSRIHFFSIFNSAWQRAVESPRNVRSGFRKCGLVPFNPNAVAYDRLIVPAARTVPRKQVVNQHEKVGMLRITQHIEDCLTPEIKKLFHEREDNGYDITDTMPLGMLWSIFSGSKRILEGNDERVAGNGDEPSASSEVENDVAHLTDSSLNISNAPIPLLASTPPRPAAATTPPRSTTSTLYEGSNRNLNLTSKTTTGMQGLGLSSDFCNSDPGEGPSGVAPVARESSFTSWAFSPFKNHLKISDRVIFTRTRKVVRTKSKIPPAVSGKDLCSYLQNQQDEKRRAIEEKENRKRHRQTEKERKEKKIKEGRGQKMLLRTLMMKMM